MIAESTVDCYGEEEQRTGLATMIEDNLETPFTTMVLGLAVTVRGVIHTSGGLVADCVHGQPGQAIHVLDRLLPEPAPRAPSASRPTRHWAL
jgi:hypothetical protein